MRRVMLPLAPALAAIDVRIPVEIVIVVDVDVSTAPIAITPVVRPCGPQDDAGPHRESHPRHVSWIGIRVIRICGRPVNNRRIVGGDVNNFRVRLLNNDDLLASLHRLSFHSLLLAGLQSSFASRLSAHALHCIQHILLLSEKGIP